jgi:hypothetical protein
MQAVIEIDECIGWPDLRAQLLPRDQLPRSLQQRSKYLQRLSLQTQPHASLAKFARAEVKFEIVKAK